MTVRRRVQLLVVPFVLLLAGDLALDRYMADRRDASRRVITGSLEPARTATADLLQALVDQETGQRGFLITGRDDFLQPYRDGQERVDARLAELFRIFGDGRLKANVDRVHSRVTAWRQLGAEFEIEAKRNGRDAQVIDLVSTGTAMRLFDQARTEMGDLRDAVLAELASEEANLSELQDRLTTVRGASVIVGLALALTVAYLLFRWIATPLRLLEASVRAVAAGEVEREIPSPGPPDLAALGRDIEAMRVRMLAEADDANRARRALARQGMIVLTLRDELSPRTVELPSGLMMTSRFQPAEGIVAGDWFDAVRTAPDRLMVALVDVAGHGEEAAMFALKTKQLTMAAIADGKGPAEALRWLAAQLGDTGERFLTAVVLEVDGTLGRVRYANAGHPPALITGGEEVLRLDPTGPILGPLAGDWVEVAVDLPAGGTLAVYSDGVIESPDGARELGVAGLSAVLAGLGPFPLGRVADACIEHAARRPAGDRRDDLTLVLLRVEKGVGAAGAAAVGARNDPRPASTVG